MTKDEIEELKYLLIVAKMKQNEALLTTKDKEIRDVLKLNKGNNND